MANPPKTERNKLVVQLKDQKRWSMRKVAKELGLAVSTVHEIYWNEKNKVKSYPQVAH